MIYLLFFMCVSFNVLAWNDGGSYADHKEPLRQRAVVKAEPVIVVDRHVLTMADVRNDPSILIASAKPVVKVVELEPQVIKVQAEPVYVMREQEKSPIISVTWESD
jgi:hypothetical protein